MFTSDAPGAMAPRIDDPTRSRARKCANTPCRWLAASLLVLLLAACGRNSNGIVVESVDNYSLRNGPSLNNSVANGDGFIKGMTVNASPWALKTRWTDLNVWDTDLMDPDGRQAMGDDGANFDSPRCGDILFHGARVLC